MAPETEMGGPAGEFPATRWTLVSAARSDPDLRRRALEELLGRYWKPLYFLARREGRSIESAKDDVQGFIARLLDRDFLARLDPGKGSLRGYLKASFRNFLASGYEAADALKRGGGVVTLTLDFDLAERQASAAPGSAEDAFEREWAVGVLERATERLRREFETGGRKGPYDLLRRAFAFGEAPPLAEAAREHGMSVPAIKAFLHRARLRFRELVRAEVVETTADPADADAEIDRLLKALRP
jgi:DNA-directed RNA polymerase specialized sigma24 family protein